MTGTQIHATEKKIADVFCRDFQFEIPNYQRRYSWTTEQAGEMFDDLRLAAGASDESPYFLGSLVLTKQPGEPLAQVVDGQQRLTTLTILLSVLRLHVDEAFAQALSERLFQRGDALAGTQDEPRLLVRKEDRDFFGERIHSAIDATMTLDPVAIKQDSRQLIVENAQLFHERLQQLDAEEVSRLAKYIDSNTWLVVVSTPESESAFRIFSVLNERGLDLSHTDIFKADVIGKLAGPDEEVYTRRWENEEDDLGREGFGDLFHHIRMVYARSKSRETIFKEFRHYVLDEHPDPKDFIDNVLVPYSDAYEQVSRADYVASHGADEVNAMLRWLGKLDNQDWVPTAIWFFRSNPTEPELLLRFTQQLERLAASMFLRRVDVTKRIDRYAKVLNWLEAGGDVNDVAGTPLGLTDEEKLETVRRLQGDIYTVQRTRLYTLLRLEAALADRPDPMELPQITVEHVLPQTMTDAWRAWFTDDQHDQWVHKLGNLALLATRKNSELGNASFAVKKQKYFTMKKGGSPFALTSTILAHDEWLPSTIAERQAEGVRRLASLWDLGEPADEAPTTPAVATILPVGS